MTQKQKYHLLLAGIGLFTLIAYHLAFGKTWAAFSNSQSIQVQLSDAGQAWQQIENYQQQLTKMESQQNNQFFTQNYLFQKVTSFCQEEQLSIQEMPESTIYEQEDVEILHNQIRVQGTFIPMVKLLYELEQQQKLGRIVSVEFSLGKNYQSRKQELTADIYLQNIQSKTLKK